MPRALVVKAASAARCRAADTAATPLQALGASRPRLERPLSPCARNHLAGVRRLSAAYSPVCAPAATGQYQVFLGEWGTIRRAREAAGRASATVAGYWVGWFAKLLE
ncbi:hypothetical protein SORBI_3001G062400 [Sorghum bicolor]|uniref:Uncharacterized protein n=1 Tax=Sorghum bicolor TaxID=4558 RepID=A0A1B6QHJ0_SORBI|nr:hypothetical protein SORBI_3001G062400 [Sorghum bicolor]